MVQRCEVLDDVRRPQQVGAVGDAVLGDDVAVAARADETGLVVVLVARVELREHVHHAGRGDASPVARILDLVRQRRGLEVLDHLLAIVVDAAKVEDVAQHVDEEVARKQLQEELCRLVELAGLLAVVGVGPRVHQQVRHADRRHPPAAPRLGRTDEPVEPPVRRHHVKLRLERSRLRVGEAVDLDSHRRDRWSGRPHAHAVREGGVDDWLVEDDPKVDEVA
mmetsp:Transcript_41465/g.127848  ORF Transcript_41465/g.127848 Transcript_41465/m.127848 type:complete len:222 (-) Transcript_41465:709-1374(-)